jgi:hypothetical protein
MLLIGWIEVSMRLIVWLEIGLFGEFLLLHHVASFTRPLQWFGF